MSKKKRTYSEVTKISILFSYFKIHDFLGHRVCRALCEGMHNEQLLFEETSNLFYRSGLGSQKQLLSSATYISFWVK